LTTLLACAAMVYAIGSAGSKLAHAYLEWVEVRRFGV